MWCIVPHVHVRTCEVGVVSHVLTRVVDTCEIFVCAITCVRVRYGGVVHVCTHLHDAR